MEKFFNSVKTPKKEKLQQTWTILRMYDVLPNRNLLSLCRAIISRAAPLARIASSSLAFAVELSGFDGAAAAFVSDVWTSLYLNVLAHKSKTSRSRHILQNTNKYSWFN